MMITCLMGVAVAPSSWARTAGDVAPTTAAAARPMRQLFIEATPVALGRQLLGPLWIDRRVSGRSRGSPDPSAGVTLRRTCDSIKTLLWRHDESGNFCEAPAALTRSCGARGASAFPLWQSFWFYRRLMTR